MCENINLYIKSSCFSWYVLAIISGNARVGKTKQIQYNLLEYKHSFLLHNCHLENAKKAMVFLCFPKRCSFSTSYSYLFNVFHLLAIWIFLRLKKGMWESKIERKKEWERKRENNYKSTFCQRISPEKSTTSTMNWKIEAWLKNTFH